MVRSSPEPAEVDHAKDQIASAFSNTLLEKSGAPQEHQSQGSSKGGNHPQQPHRGPPMPRFSDLSECLLKTSLALL